MTNVWVGDTRSRSLEYLTTAENSIPETRHYIIDDRATFNWFESSGRYLLNQLCLINSNIIIMLGFADCLESCFWPDLDIKDIAKAYAEIINTAVDTPNSNAWYVCSVCPVEGVFSSVFSDTGKFTAKELNEKIIAFNDQLKQFCKATFIDCNSYLAETGLSTYDGVRYTSETAAALQNYIISQISGGANEFISPRLEEPVIAEQDIDSPLFWLSRGTDAEGYSPFEASERGGKYVGDTLPDNRAYAWGRLYEILLAEPTITATLTADKWFSSSHGYPTGQTPRPGAIACWGPSDGNTNEGFVAVVEQINPDGSILTSESIADDVYWQLVTRYEGEDENWGLSGDYKFQGFIYHQNTLPNGSVTSTISKAQVTSSNESLGTGLIDENYSNVSGISDKMKANALYIWQYFGSRGWTLNAVAGLLGNLQRESTINPGRWQGGREWGDPYKHGYGLVQWTPYTKYTDWCNENGYDMADIDSALIRIEAEIAASEVGGWSDLDQWITTDDYNISFKDFTTSTRDAAWLGAAFLMNYERPGDQSKAAQTARGRNATYWYNFLLPHSPDSSAWDGITCLKADNISATEATFSFVTNSVDTYTYKVSPSSGADITGTVIDAKQDTSNSIRVVSFIVKGLEPGTKYMLSVITAEGQDEIPVGVLEFETPQEYPESVDAIKLSTAEMYAVPTSKFKLEATPSNVNFGYWSKKNDHGYTLQLIINGQLVKEKTVDALPSTIKIKTTFNYTAKVGDTVQIGIRSWVKHKGKKLYDNGRPADAFTKVSNPVCLLTKHVTAYINTK